MKISNPWIGYVQRGYEQIMSAIRSRMATETPEITDVSASNPFIKIANVFAGIAEHLNFYIDRMAREAFLPTMRSYASAVKFAALVDYRVRGVLPASVDLEFSVATVSPTPTLIPLGTVARTVTGIEYRTTAAVTLPAGQLSVTVAARNWLPITATSVGVANGSSNQRFELPATVVDNNITVSITASPWTAVDTFAFSNAVNQHFRPSINAAGNMELVFPDGASGKRPGAGQSVLVTYYTSDGAAGNVAANTIVEMSTLTTSNGSVLSVRNPQRASGGTNAEGLEELRKRIPLSLRTLDRAVTEQDYIDVALLAPGVAQAGVIYACGKYVDVYIAPTGGGIASTDLLASTDSFFEKRRMVTTKVKSYPAGEVQLKFTIRLKVADNYYRDATKALALSNLLRFMSIENQAIRGTVEIGDVYETLENTLGVAASEVLVMTTIPYARPVEHAHALDWEVETLPDSNRTIKWRLSLIAAGQLEVVKGSNYVGVYGYDEIVELPELAFRVADDDYAVGSVWEFFAYAYTGTLTLVEQSVPVTSADLISFTVTGGLV